VFGGKLHSEFEKGTVFRVVKQMVGKNRDVVGMVAQQKSASVVMQINRLPTRQRLGLLSFITCIWSLN
jgi:hypothetical protein